MTDADMLAKLQAENTRLIALLDAHSIDWRPAKDSIKIVVIPIEHSLTVSTNEKIDLFRRLFRGRTDVYPIRWESKTGKSGYSPACANEWRAGVCDKPRTKCGDCSNRQLLPLTNEVIYRHLAGDVVVGIYPLLPDDTCYFLAVDFDEAEWRNDARAFVQSCRELDIPVALEVSRSGNGAHGWIFFERNIPAYDARRLGAAIISHACERTRQLALSSYDRLFPNQDSMPKGGFGNLIALPLQKRARANNNSVFVDDFLEPQLDQWAFLATIQRMVPTDVEPTIVRATGHRDPLDVTYVDDENYVAPWKGRESESRKLACPLPETLRITLANLIYFEKSELPQPLANKLIRLAAFQNPEFYKAQAMRMSVWNKPRIIGCAEHFPSHIALPRGCIDSVLELLGENGITPVFNDERFVGKSIHVSFSGTLRGDQEVAVAAMLKHHAGVLSAPTAFGKTVSAAALIAKRGVNTLILVHRTDLLRQWQERLQAFLDVGKGVIGTIGGGKAKPTGIIDVAVMQSLSRKGVISEKIKDYGQIIVDECHHLSAISFETLLKNASAKYVVGLTATPVRRDGQQPIIFMQCGPIRHTAARPQSAPRDLSVMPRLLSKPISVAEGSGIQDVFRHLSSDAERTSKIVADIELAFNQGRKVLVLTERTDHVDILEAELRGRIDNVFTLHGRVPKKQRITRLSELEALPPDAPRVLLATGKLVGEGFDHPPLDTLVLAMPISWKGILQQYAGRLHREHADKTDVQVIDYVDLGHAALLRMWEKRQVGYKAMGYRVLDGIGSMELL
ncbi:DEAD/DEAH box helicase family protein [Pseudomonas sp. CCI3.2]|uniref:TOTE conflict system archaeo-eukaryotic primase domain-containing protein n=2 Tax=Pseudomonas TaxID=286 RepID=UPI002AC9F18E|nr:MULTISPECIES: DEAD/DEAH box helicase family protein [unclassified Pseudomonas]MEB0078410.1 DEAD/DEAH box helicase family protein [Pseudomonas sp. MH10out]MEB0100280.1 DEAD/DEAH box helicase family protein [Pseudomonas sp. CCI3.2]MEB0130178.1 DEAD/DEAH box helicase family protein [Pseudomonas sp. CCI2.4]MEB0157566.1 DEAD/DEAH box helicase family protein [Pseudomonas sp. AH2 (2023)]MEB0168864.1 DEAD/DEAH box helicase family protein [Pseudomonas sp. CCC4.4]